jgi:hypothetical protein
VALLLLALGGLMRLQPKANVPLVRWHKNLWGGFKKEIYFLKRWL